jgi:hypothetical protein
MSSYKISIEVTEPMTHSLNALFISLFGTAPYKQIFESPLVIFSSK